MRKGEIGKIFGIALVLVMLGAMFGTVETLSGSLIFICWRWSARLC